MEKMESSAAAPKALLVPERYSKNIHYSAKSGNIENRFKNRRKTSESQSGRNETQNSKLAIRLNDGNHTWLS
jgi:hypothetical protein